MNLYQTPLKYVPVSHHIIAKKGLKSVSIACCSDKRCITGTFLITLEEDFLPFQLIYGGKTKQSLPRYKFPDSFSLSVNPKRFSNKEESIKIIEEIVLPMCRGKEKHRMIQVKQLSSFWMCSGDK